MDYKDIGKSICIIADDLTGAADAALQFAKRGLKTLILSVGDYAEKSQMRSFEKDYKGIPVLAINTGSRDAGAKKAYKVVNNIFELIKSRNLIYKKVDSTLRGNIGAEIDAITDATGKELVIFAAAYPQYKRYTINGIHYIGDVPLSCTEISKDPVKPVTNSDVIKIISKQSQKKIAMINHQIVIHGSNVLSKKIIAARDQGNQIIACDAVSGDDLNKIALAVLEMEELPIIAGSAGLAEAVADILAGSKNRIKKIQKNVGRSGPILIVSGSVSNVALEQINFLQDFDNVETYSLSADSIILKEDSKEQKIEKLVDHVLKLLKCKEITIMRIGKEVKIPGMPKKQLSRKIVKTLGLITKLILEKRQSKIKGIILTGGDTADAVIKSIGSQGIWIDAEVQPGIPFGFLFQGPYDGLPVITKAGAFGKEDALRICSEYLIESKN